MVTTLGSIVLALTVSSTGGLFHHGPGGNILRDGPGNGWGFPNGAPDGYGWVDYGYALPLGANRTPDYYFPRNFSLPAVQLVPSTYYNPYVTRGQRYLSYSNCGGWHPAGGLPPASAETPIHPYSDQVNNRPVVAPPRFTGRVEGTAIPSGGTGLIP